MFTINGWIPHPRKLACSQAMGWILAISVLSPLLVGDLTCKALGWQKSSRLKGEKWWKYGDKVKQTPSKTLGMMELNLWLELKPQVISDPSDRQLWKSLGLFNKTGNGPRTCGDLLLMAAPLSPREILRNFPLPPQGGRREPVPLTQVAGRFDALGVWRV